MSLIIFPASTAQALSLTSRVARFMAQLVSFSYGRLQRFGREAAERDKRKEKKNGAFNIPFHMSFRALNYITGL